MLVAWLARTRSGVWPGILPLDRRRFVGFWFLLFSLFFGAIVPVYVLTGWVGRGIHALSKLDAPYASLVEAGLADLAAAVLVIGLYGAWLFRARPLVTRLARCLRLNRHPRFWFLVFGPAVLVCTVLTGTGWLQLWTSIVFSSALMVGVWAGMRAHKLGEIIRALSALPAERLAQADRGLAKFTARVAPSVRTTVGPLSQRELAAYHVKIYEVRDEHTQRGTNRTAACVRHDYRLRGVPIVDYSKPDSEGDLADSVRLVPWDAYSTHRDRSFRLIVTA